MLAKFFDFEKDFFAILSIVVAFFKDGLLWNDWCLCKLYCSLLGQAGKRAEPWFDLRLLNHQALRAFHLCDVEWCQRFHWLASLPLVCNLLHLSDSNGLFFFNVGANDLLDFR